MEKENLADNVYSCIDCGAESATLPEKAIIEDKFLMYNDKMCFQIICESCLTKREELWDHLGSGDRTSDFEPDFLKYLKDPK